MKLLKSVAENFTKAVDFVVEKNRKIALVNRIKTVIANEEKKKDQAYIALGKYYYRHLRETENESTEPFCAVVDNSNRRIDRALQKLEELYEEEMKPYDECAACSCGDCSSCGQETQTDEDVIAQPEEVEELQKLDGAEKETADESDGRVIPS